MSSYIFITLTCYTVNFFPFARQWRMAGQPTPPAKDILMLNAPYYHNVLFIIETVELAQYLSYILITLPCYTVKFLYE